MKDNFSELLQQEMSRREFLITLGYGAASLVGLAGLLKMMGHHGPNSSGSGGQGYGRSSYGR